MSYICKYSIDGCDLLEYYSLDIYDENILCDPEFLDELVDHYVHEYGYPYEKTESILEILGLNNKFKVYWDWEVFWSIYEDI